MTKVITATSFIHHISFKFLPRLSEKSERPVSIDIESENGTVITNDTQKVNVLSLPETIKEKSTFRAKALRRELVVQK